MRRFFLFLLVLFSIDTFAQESVIDGLQYSINDSLATLDYIDPMADNISREIVVPSSVKIDGKQYPVKIIGKEAFSFAEIESITIPNNVDSIAPRAFSHCKKLTRVILPDGLTCISKGAFYGCTSLVNITLPDSIKIVDDFAFRECHSLEEIEIPEGCEVIGDFCFYECHSLKKAILGANIKSIGDNAFFRVFKLEEIVVKALMPPSFKTTMDYYLYKKRLVVPADAMEWYRKDVNWGRMEVVGIGNPAKPI